MLPTRIIFDWMCATTWMGNALQQYAPLGCRARQNITLISVVAVLILFISCTRKFNKIQRHMQQASLHRPPPPETQKKSTRFNDTKATRVTPPTPTPPKQKKINKIQRHKGNKRHDPPPPPRKIPTISDLATTWMLQVHDN